MVNQNLLQLIKRILREICHRPRTSEMNVVFFYERVVVFITQLSKNALCCRSSWPMKRRIKSGWVVLIRIMLLILDLLTSSSWDGPRWKRQAIRYQLVGDHCTAFCIYCSWSRKTTTTKEYFLSFRSAADSLAHCGRFDKFLYHLKFAYD